jgi:hypothetical protein
MTMMTTAQTFLVIFCGVSAFCSSVANGAFVPRPTLSCWTTTDIRSAEHRVGVGTVSFASSSSTPWNEQDDDGCDDDYDITTMYDDNTAPTVYTGTDIPSSSSSSSSSSRWSPIDDWNQLSSESSHNRVPDSGTIMNQDLAQKAARAMEQGMATTAGDLQTKESLEEHAWLKDTLDNILTVSEEDNDDDDDQDQDSRTGSTEKLDGLDKERFVDDMGREIALLVRCNKSPEDMLIQEGRALPPLTEEQRNDVTQLVTIVRGKTEGWHMSDFFEEAVAAIFDTHAVAVDDDNQNVLDAVGVAAWMKKSLGAEEPGPIGQHNQRVRLTIATFSKYGSGHLDRDDFRNLYMAAIVGESTPEWRQLNYRAFEIMGVWRDLRNHGIVSPVETMRAELMEEFGSKYKTGPSSFDDFMDESAFLEEGIVDDLFGRGKRIKSSHEMVELASDKKTPLWIRDGDFGTYTYRWYTS